MQQKQILRKQILVKRDSLSKKEILEKSEKIKNFLFLQKEYQKSTNIFFYVSFGSEVSTHSIIKESLLIGKKIIVPKTVKKTKELLLYYLFDFDKDLSIGNYGILEPSKKQIKPISYDEIELIIVPGIAFSKTGHRIGYGKGYFDRFLAKVNCKKIGLAYTMQIVDTLLINKYDIRVEKIISEEGVVVSLSNGYNIE